MMQSDFHLRHLADPIITVSSHKHPKLESSAWLPSKMLADAYLNAMQGEAGESAHWRLGM